MSIVKKLEENPDVEDAEALAAWIGKQKYGAAGMKKKAEEDKKRKTRAANGRANRFAEGQGKNVQAKGGRK